MAVLEPQKTPWHPLPNREIVDAENNVVQYTQANIGLICLTINAHKKLVDALLGIEAFLIADQFTFDEIFAVIRDATGRLGPATIAAAIETALEGSFELDLLVANELQIPVAAYTTSIDMAMTLIPTGRACAFVPHDDGTMIATISTETSAIVGVHKSLPCAIAAACMRARSE